MPKTAQFIEEQNAANVDSELERNEAPEYSTTGRDGRKMHPNSLKNLIAPWKAGEIHNPTGKNQFDEASAIARQVIGNNKEEIYKAMTKGLLSGNFYGFDVIANRGFGKLKEKVEHSISAELVTRLSLGRKRVNGTDDPTS